VNNVLKVQVSELLQDGNTIVIFRNAEHCNRTGSCPSSREHSDSVISCSPPTPVSKLSPLEEVLNIGLALEAARILEPLRVHEVMQRRQRHHVEPAIARCDPVAA
jgi:hypothetical protein